MPARRVTGTCYTGHKHSRLDHASALANRNALTAAHHEPLPPRADRLSSRRAEARPGVDRSVAAPDETARLAGPQSVLNQYPQTRNLKALPFGAGFGTLGAEWAANPSELGSATPQGVECTFAGYVNGTCLNRLKNYIASTGGSYYAH